QANWPRDCRRASWPASKVPPTFPRLRTGEAERRESLPASYPVGSSSTLSSLDSRDGCNRLASHLTAARLSTRRSRRQPRPRGECSAGEPAFATMGAVTSTEEIRQSLATVIDPELRRSIVEPHRVRSIETGENGVVDVTVLLTTAGCPNRRHLPTDVTDGARRSHGGGPLNDHLG